jgi:hypothetical protein
VSGDEDSPEARAARAAQRRREADAAARASARAELGYEKDRWRGLQRACAPWGWAFDGVLSYLIGYGFIMGLTAAAYVTFQFTSVSFVDFFDDLGPGSAVWLPIAIIGSGFALPFALRAIATPGANRAIETEQQWLAALPFPAPSLAHVVRAYGASARAHGGAKFRVSLYFDGGDPPTARVNDLCAAASIPVIISHHSGKELRLEMLVPGATDYKVGRNIRLLFHDLAVGVLAPLHKERSIGHVELSS